MADNFWLNDGQWAAIEPHLPKLPIPTGPARKDDRRVVSGIVRRLREGCRWRALPDAYGPTVFNRYNRASIRECGRRFSPLSSKTASLLRS
jgi:transposase